MDTAKKNIYRRVMLKLSGEALMGKKDYGISVEVIEDIARDIMALLSRKSRRSCNLPLFP